MILIFEQLQGACIKIREQPLKDPIVLICDIVAVHNRSSEKNLVNQLTGAILKHLVKIL